MYGISRGSGLDLDPNGWSWLSTIRDGEFAPASQGAQTDVGLEIAALERTLAHVGYMLQAAYTMIDDSNYGVDQTKATLLGVLSLLCMTESPLAMIIRECDEVRLLRTKLEALQIPEVAAEGAPEADEQAEAS